jgi:hypothetical protein
MDRARQAELGLGDISSPFWKVAIMIERSCFVSGLAFIAAALSVLPLDDANFQEPK